MRKLPIGEQSFQKLIEEDCVYIDKTEYIYHLIKTGSYYFMSRPRRFGKSLLLSTIEAYFLGKKELFKGLYVYDVEKKWAVHPIMHLDFNSQRYDSPQRLDNILNDFLCYQEEQYGSRPSEVDLGLRFMGVIRRAYEKTGQRVVILVDEYDKPLLQAEGNAELQEEYRSTLRAFYGALKSTDAYIQFALLTGITKFSKISIFSDLNNLNDISRDKQYALLCGLTDNEIDKFLQPYITNFANKTNQPYEILRQRMKQMYDGYHFVANSAGLYNPYSVMCALNKCEFGNYWFETGTPTILVDMLRQSNYQLQTLVETPIDTIALDSKDDLQDSIVPLLFQSGYLSITKTDENDRICWMDFPNDEVRDGFFRFLLPYYTTIQKSQTALEIDSFIFDIQNGNIEQFLVRLQSFFADFQYDAQTTPEAHFRNVLYIMCKLIGLKAEVEYQTSDGRIDLLISTDQFIYIIECKIDSTAQKALQQIHRKRYALPWILDHRKVYLVGLNFSTENRIPIDWLVEEYNKISSGKKTHKSSDKKLQKSSGKKLQKSSDKSSEKILIKIRKYPTITQKELAVKLSLSDRQVNKIISKLKEDNKIRRVGGRKNGYWEFVN